MATPEPFRDKGCGLTRQGAAGRERPAVHSSESDRPASKCLRQTSILQNFIGGDARFELLVDSNVHLCFRIPPNFMVTSALSLELETCRSQSRYDVSIIIGHERSLREVLHAGQSVLAVASHHR
jgi:hypothetical protein